VTCSACGARNHPNSRYCAQCGERLTAPASDSPAPRTTIEPRRLGRGDLVALAGTVVVFVSLYLPWYSISLSGFDSLYGGGGAVGWISALGDGAGGWRFLILVVCLVIAGYLFLRMMISRDVRMPLPHWQLLTALTALNLVLVLIAFLVKPGGGTTVSGLSIGWDYGAYLGLGGGALAVIGGVIRRTDPELLGPSAPRTTAVPPTTATAAQPPAPAADPPRRAPNQQP